LEAHVLLLDVYQKSDHALLGAGVLISRILLGIIIEILKQRKQIIGCGIGAARGLT
jgi:hypothetical protein